MSPDVFLSSVCSFDKFIPRFESLADGFRRGGGGIGAQPTNSSAGGRVKTSGFGKKEMLRTSSWTPHFVTDLLPIVTSSFALVTSSDALATEGNVEPSHPRFKRGSCVAVRCNTGRSGGGSVRRAPKPRRSKGPT